MTYNEFLDKAAGAGFFSGGELSELAAEHDDDCPMLNDVNQLCSCGPNIYMIVNNERVDLLVNGELITN